MKLLYDKKIIIEKYDDENYIIYSPFNHKFTKASKSVKKLVLYILNENGEIEFENIINYYKQFDIELKIDEIKKYIDTLVKAKLFFYNQEDYDTEKRITLEDYRFSPTQEIDMVYIHPTLRCNFNCSYCYNKSLAATQKELTTNQWIQIINKLKAMNVNYFIFTGGEPLMRKDLIDIIREIKDDNTKVEILSNGSLLMDKVDQLLPIVDSFVVSLDSLDIKKNSINRSAVGFNNIINLLEYFSEKAPKKLRVRSVITKENIDTIQAFNNEIQEKYGIKCVNVRFIPNNKDELSLIAEPPIPDIDDTKKYKLDLGIRKYRCGACSNILAINPEGDIYPCQSLMLPEFKLANILDDNWQDTVANSEVTKKFRNIKVDDMENCKDCAYRYICGGGCPAIAYKVYGDLNHHLSFFCDYLEKESRQRMRMAKIISK
ncbi:thioether cross-link-forming SCIFF peptide maturase [Vallitalea longa]|uniref:Thioether cross-link-forming SCIFF peptide maturase n=1 Tax=Vallitalea longa TaxID=2936439 RepID=A0A9W5Y723_9FIRM|nr:radical SAM protein [Vallitalea longa]GKX27640.1 thioether cross-link-forming SCIFF peptide maturase [Vallitalea longa]